MSGLKFGAAVACALLAASGAVFAGQKSYISLQVNAASRDVQGGMAETHNTADSTSYLECGTSASAGYCTAVTSANVVYGCVTSDANMIAAIRSMSPNALIDFEWNTAGQCTYILSYGSSRAAEKSH